MRRSIRGGVYDSVGDLRTEGIAYAMQRRAPQTKMEVLGVPHPDMIRMMVNLVYIWYYQSRYREVEPIALQVLELRKKIFGAEDDGTVT